MLFRACVLLGLSASAAYRVPAPRMGLFDGVKDAFGAKQGDSDKPLVAADRVTPFDRWLGLDKELVAANEPDKTASYVDPTSVTNYFSSSLTKPMGIAFVENENACGGVYVEDVLAEVGLGRQEGLMRGRGLGRHLAAEESSQLVSSPLLTRGRLSSHPCLAHSRCGSLAHIRAQLRARAPSRRGISSSRWMR